MKTSLARKLPQLPMDEEEMRDRGRALWRDRGIVFLLLEDITNPFERQAVINAANSVYGGRNGISD